MSLLEEGLPISAALLVIIPLLETAEIMRMARITDRGNIVKCSDETFLYRTFKQYSESNHIQVWGIRDLGSKYS